MNETQLICRGCGSFELAESCEVGKDSACKVCDLCDLCAPQDIDTNQIYHDGSSEGLPF